jgi:hypothetical protein
MPAGNDDTEEGFPSKVAPDVSKTDAPDDHPPKDPPVKTKPKTLVPASTPVQIGLGIRSK